MNSTIPGHDLGSQLARLDDARYWRRVIRTRLLREREHFYLRLKLLGRAGERYVSDSQVIIRLAQIRRQKQWMKDVVLVPRYLGPDDKCELLTLAAVAGDAHTRSAKTYAFIKAMEAIATERGLISAMVTLTALPEWHPNPSHGDNSWNGGNPREAHRHIAEGWNAIQVELYKKGVGISGLRVVEPHQDGCAHWHIWLIYRSDVETEILAAVMRQFPGKLKVRAPSRRGQRVNPRDVMFDKTRTRWLTVETVRASVITRTQSWTLTPISRVAQAIARAKDAFVARAQQNSPAELGVRAIRRFWATFHDACAGFTHDVAEQPLLAFVPVQAADPLT